MRALARFLALRAERSLGSRGWGSWDPVEGPLGASRFLREQRVHSDWFVPAPLLDPHPATVLAGWASSGDIIFKGPNIESSIDPGGAQSRAHKPLNTMNSSNLLKNTRISNNKQDKRE